MLYTKIKPVISENEESKTEKPILQYYCKNCEWSKEFFRSCNFLRDGLYEKEKIYSPSRKLEDQSCIKYLYDGFETVNSNIKLIDQDIVSHPRIGISDENFAHHFWMSSNPNRLELINYIKNLP